MQVYSNPERENDEYALPNVEVFYHDARNDKGTHEWSGHRSMNGWYWWPCFPGCLPDSDPIGPFATEEEAIADAQEGN